MLFKGIPYDNTGVTVELGDLVAAGVDVWAFDYPSYYKGDEKAAFEQKVLDHYRFRQIGQETPARFLHYFRTRMREIMPYYIQLYESADLLFAQGDPLESYNLTETYEREATGESDGETERRYSNTPQTRIENLDDFLTEGETTGSKGSATNKESYTLTRRGNIGVQPLGQEINAYRDALINIDEQVINELNDLFLKVY